MAGVKKYKAKVGLNFDGLKDKPRVEPGKPIPADVPAQEIAELLKIDAIEEIIVKKKEDAK
jgi:hypothetical protein